MNFIILELIIFYVRIPLKFMIAFAKKD